MRVESRSVYASSSSVVAFHERPSFVQKCYGVSGDMVGIRAEETGHSTAAPWSVSAHPIVLFVRGRAHAESQVREAVDEGSELNGASSPNLALLAHK